VTDPSAQLVDVHMVDIPVAVWARTQEHIDELLREFTLITSHLQESGSAEVPVRLMELIEELTDRYGGLNTDQENRLAAAAAGGVEAIDLVYRIPPTGADASKRLRDILEEADAYCRAGTHLLTLATPPELLRFRRWFLDEFINQLGGRAPTRYCDYPG
jgi:hypothetical protein